MSLGANGKASKTSRVVGYAFDGLDAAGVVIARMLLREALARGDITQHDGARDLVWWNGPPGKAMRALRDEIAALPGARAAER